MGLFEGINQQGLLPVRQELQVDAEAFFIISLAFFKRSCSSCGRRISRRSDSTCRSSCTRSGWGVSGNSLWRFMDGNLRAGELVLPVVQRRPAHAKLLSNRLRTPLASAQFEDRRLLQFG